MHYTKVVSFCPSKSCIPCSAIQDISLTIQFSTNRVGKEPKEISFSETWPGTSILSSIYVHFTDPNTQFKLYSIISDEI